MILCVIDAQIQLLQEEQTHKIKKQKAVIDANAID